MGEGRMRETETVETVETVEMVDMVVSSQPQSTATPRHCSVCGCAGIATDEVEARGWLQLAECTRCEARWIEPLGPAGGPAARAAVRRARPLADAA